MTFRLRQLPFRHYYVPREGRGWLTVTDLLIFSLLNSTLVVLRALPKDLFLRKVDRYSCQLPRETAEDGGTGKYFYPSNLPLLRFSFHRRERC